MPYISPDSRNELQRETLVKMRRPPSEPGELNYMITELLFDYLRAIGGSYTYDKFNSLIGVLECAKLELYRRMVAPYEDKKKEENGDVYPSS